MTHDRLGGQHQAAGERRHRQQLEEAAAGVLGIAHSRRGHRVQAAEQVGRLEDDEDGKDRIDRHDDDEGLRRAEEAEPIPDARILACWRLGHEGQRTGRDPGEHGGRGQPPGQLPEIELHAEEIADQASEDRIRGREERSEDDDDRQGDERPTQVGAGGRQPAACARRRTGGRRGIGNDARAPEDGPAGQAPEEGNDAGKQAPRDLVTADGGQRTGGKAERGEDVEKDRAPGRRAGRRIRRGRARRRGATHQSRRSEPHAGGAATPRRGPAPPTGGS